MHDQPRFAELQESIRDARSAADRVRLIVRDLRIFSRSEEDRRGAVDIKTVLESTLRMAWNEIRHRARLVTTFGDVPPVEANEARLGQVFLNLIVNAAQAIQEGNANQNEIRVSTSVDSVGRVVVEIADTGPGMTAETMRSLFVPFFTTKPAGVGTGLGLAICHRIVHELGGEITVTSEVGGGTVFKVHMLPARSAVIEPPPEPPPVVASRRGRILVVDDDEMLAHAVSRTLMVSHDVEVCTRAVDALERVVAGSTFDVILCDLMMPVVTGMEFYERLRAAVPAQCERIVFMTGGAFTSGSSEFLDRVPNARLEKPFALRSLRTLVNERVG
jgi:CheY-like chemotaxis protein